MSTTQDRLAEALKTAVAPEHTPDAVALLLHQYFADRVTDLKWAQYLHMLRFVRFCTTSRVCPPPPSHRPLSAPLSSCRGKSTLCTPPSRHPARIIALTPRCQPRYTCKLVRHRVHTDPEGTPGAVRRGRHPTATRVCRRDGARRPAGTRHRRRRAEDVTDPGAGLPHIPPGKRGHPTLATRVWFDVSIQ